MSSRFINGARYAVSQAVAAAVAMSAISNANPAVALAAATPNNGSIVILNSGWPDLNDTIARTAGEVEAVSFQLEGVNTISTARYPATEGIGTYAIVSSFLSLSQVRDVQTEGGGQNYFTYRYVDDAGSRERRKPTSKSAKGFNMILDYDPDLAWYAGLIELDRLQQPVVVRETLPDGDYIYHYGYVSFDKEPSRVIDENMTNTLTFSPLCDSIRYAG